MKKDIIVSGVGGQGILSIASVIGLAALDSGLYLKQSEVHGMSQRGGDVQSHLRISDKPVFSDLIPIGKGDLIISVEPMEALRYKSWLTKGGWIVTNSCTMENIPNYPQIEEIREEIFKIENHVFFDADAVANTIKSPRSGNMVVLGAASPYIGIQFEILEKAVRTHFLPKGTEIAEKNVLALHEGRKYSKYQD